MKFNNYIICEVGVVVIWFLPFSHCNIGMSEECVGMSEECVGMSEICDFT